MQQLETQPRYHVKNKEKLLRVIGQYGMRRLQLSILSKYLRYFLHNNAHIVSILWTIGYKHVRETRKERGCLCIVL